MIEGKVAFPTHGTIGGTALPDLFGRQSLGARMPQEEMTEKRHRTVFRQVREPVQRIDMSEVSRTLPDHGSTSSPRTRFQLGGLGGPDHLYVTSRLQEALVEFLCDTRTSCTVISYRLWSQCQTEVDLVQKIYRSDWPKWEANT